MKTDKKILKSATMVAGALLTTSLAASPGVHSDLLAYRTLGSGAELRSQLIDQHVNRVNDAEAIAYKFGEMKCGEGKCGEGKCGEGDKKKEAKKKEAEKKEVKPSETQSADTKSKEKKETKKKKK